MWRKCRLTCILVGRAEDRFFEESLIRDPVFHRDLQAVSDFPGKVLHASLELNVCDALAQDTCEIRSISVLTNQDLT